jgi:hypothetical protein
MAIKRNAEGKIIAKKFSSAKLMRAAEENGVGFCRACGAEAHGVEPDARRYKCDACELNFVYGAEELLLMTAF